MEEIADLLRETRENSGIDLSEVSKDLDISEIILENIEQGKIGSFKDIFLLKSYLSSYAKYLGLDADKMLANFNEYVFEYTSKIPVKEIEKEIEQTSKEISQSNIMSPYTMPKNKSRKKIYVLIYILIFILVLLAIFWSVNQITVNNQNAYIISYRK